MLGSVFNRHQASTNPEPLKAQQTRLRVLKIGKVTHPFSEFKGLGPPGSNIGLPGDIYIDLTPELHALYARYSEKWTLWPGPQDISTLVLHPMSSDRCLWCNDTVGWFHPRNVRVNPSKTASELLSEALKHQAASSEESKKRKREALGQDLTRTKPFMVNTTSPTHLHSTTSPGYPQSTLGIMIPGIPIATPIFTIQNSDIGSPANSNQSSILAETDHIVLASLLSHDPDKSPERAPQERYTSPKRIDLRKIAIRSTQPKPFTELQMRRVTFPTHGVDARSRHSVNEAQSLSQLIPDVISQPSASVHPTNTDISTFYKTSRVSRNDDASLEPSTKTDSTGTSGISFADHDNNGRLHDSTSLTSTDWDLTSAAYNEDDLANEAPLTKAAQEDHIDNGLTLDIAIAKLREMKDVSDANAAYLKVANDKICRLEAENSKLRARLLDQCQCKLSSCDAPPMGTKTEMPLATRLDTLNGASNPHGEDIAGLCQPQREYPCETAEDAPPGSQVYRGYQPCNSGELESSSVPTCSVTSASLLLAETVVLAETAPCPVPPLESATAKYRDIIDTFRVDADTPSLGEHKSLERSMSTSPSAKEERVDLNSRRAPVPMPALLQMREIHRSVLFAKAGSLLICRLCLGLRGIETLDQAFKTAEGSPDILQEHCEKEHPNDCEALMAMSDEELLNIVSMISRS